MKHGSSSDNWKSFMSSIQAILRLFFMIMIVMFILIIDNNDDDDDRQLHWFYCLFPLKEEIISITNQHIKKRSCHKRTHICNSGCQSTLMECILSRTICFLFPYIVKYMLGCPLIHIRDGLFENREISSYKKFLS